MMFFRIVFVSILVASTRQRSPSHECGRVTPQGDPLVLGGARARHGELPWHVGVYQKTSRPYRQICGGSIVSRKLVISAAHCFWSSREQLAPAARFAVAAGKLFKPWGEPHDADAQHSNVSELMVPRLFRGADRNFAEDLALLVLERPFEYRPYLRPVCLDFDPRLEARQLRPGSKGKVAGWGLTSASGQQTAVLNAVELPVVDADECLDKSPQTYWEYITNDKICAGYNDGKTTLCQGDSGGGLVFPETTESKVVRYYLRGVVSTSPSSSSQCNAFAIASFTRLSAHRDFISARYTPDREEPAQQGSGDASSDECILPEHPANGKWVAEYNTQVLTSSKPGWHVRRDMQLKFSCSPPYQLVGEAATTCSQGRWLHPTPDCRLEDDWADCGTEPASGGSRADAATAGAARAAAGEAPWHVDLYDASARGPSARGPLRPLCGGSVVGRNMILTAAHCFGSNVSQENYRVVAGKSDRMEFADDTRTSPEPDTVQVRRIVQIIRPSGYKGQSSSFAYDLALVKVAPPFRLTARVRSVCLNLDLSPKAQRWRIEAPAKLAGWLPAAAGEAPPALRVLSLAPRGRDACAAALPQHLQRYVTHDKFCGIGSEAVCQEDSGGGLTQARTVDGVRRHFLVGLASGHTAFYRSSSAACATGNITVFTDFAESRHNIQFLIKYIPKETQNDTTTLKIPVTESPVNKLPISPRTRPIPQRTTESPPKNPLITSPDLLSLPPSSQKVVAALPPDKIESLAYVLSNKNPARKRRPVTTTARPR